MKKGIIKTVSLADIKPYWRNPRNNKDAVEKVKESIKEFGYNQPIAVDPDMVIVAGHTRFKALQELGYNEGIDVVIVDLDPKKAKQYRIIDNKTNEFATWNDDLVLELRELEDYQFMQQFFVEDIKLRIEDTAGSNHENITTNDIDESQTEMNDRYKKLSDERKNSTKTVVCPKCFEQFEIK